MFADIANRAIANARRQKQGLALVFLDLDGFKLVNDTYGHYIGDCLSQGSGFPNSCGIRETEMPARLGGDEFVILFENTDRVGVESAVARLIGKLGEPYAAGGHTDIRVSASAGVALFPADATSYSDLMRLADEALYRPSGRARTPTVSTSPVYLSASAALRLEFREKPTRFPERETDSAVELQPRGGSFRRGLRVSARTKQARIVSPGSIVPRERALRRWGDEVQVRRRIEDFSYSREACARRGRLSLRPSARRCGSRPRGRRRPPLRRLS
jgi:diguanylate cyclase (GGDEF)-like protein